MINHLLFSELNRQRSIAVNNNSTSRMALTFGTAISKWAYTSLEDSELKKFLTFVPIVNPKTNDLFDIKCNPNEQYELSNIYRNHTYNYALLAAINTKKNELNFFGKLNPCNLFQTLYLIKDLRTKDKVSFYESSDRNTHPALTIQQDNILICEPDTSSYNKIPTANDDSFFKKLSTLARNIINSFMRIIVKLKTEFFRIKNYWHHYSIGAIKRQLTGEQATKKDIRFQSYIDAQKNVINELWDALVERNLESMKDKAGKLFDLLNPKSIFTSDRDHKKSCFIDRVKALAGATPSSNILAIDQAANAIISQGTTDRPPAQNPNY